MVSGFEYQRTVRGMKITCSFAWMATRVTPPRTHPSASPSIVPKVVLPLALGQLARFTPLRKVHERKPKAISRLSECVLLSIIYTTFCDTFANRSGEAVMTYLHIPLLTLHMLDPERRMHQHCVFDGRLYGSTRRRRPLWTVNVRRLGRIILYSCARLSYTFRRSNLH